jgi:hypothetical protein
MPLESVRFFYTALPALDALGVSSLSTQFWTAYAAR